jgi:beta-lactamase regulating signal transducer with metallopeptidase domain
MTMSAFLFLLVKLNLAMGAATILVSLLRRPLRLWFGAPIAYAIWFAVPTASMAILFPPRMGAPASITPVHMPAAVVSVMGPLAHSALRVTELLTGQSPLTAIAAPPPASAFAMPELLLFAAWALGTLLMALYLTRLQLRFSAAVRLGEAGPAVLGVLRPRIVTPDSFLERFTPQEQAAILAHEHIHLARQDARINALAALLRCLCWFNPLIHLGARWLRIDQELACDATVVAESVSRRTYAKALLKSQMVVTTLPLGCNWPGSQHPLIERIALLKRKPPGTARRLAGVSLVLLAATTAGLGAWAAQPPVAAKPMAAPQPGMALASLPATVAASSQTAGEPVADANPIGNGHHVDDVDNSKNVRTDKPVSAAPLSSDPPPQPVPNASPAPAPASAQTPRTVSIDAQTQSNIAAPPQIALVSEPIADQLTVPTSQSASPEPKDTLAQNTVAEPTTGEVTAAGAASGAPRPKTEAALLCILGVGPKGCESIFRAGTVPVSKRVMWRGGYNPYFRTAQYAGRNDAGDEVWDMKFIHSEQTYVISQPDQDGRVLRLFVLFSPPNRQCDNLVEQAVAHIGHIWASCHIGFSSSSS